MKRAGERKARSDKKVDVKATMSLALKRQLYDFAELCGVPVKDLAERLCVDALTSKCIMDIICKWTRRNYFYNNTIVIGYSERPKLKLHAHGETGTVSMRYNQWDYDKLCELAHALDHTPSSTSTILIRLTVKNAEFMDSFVNDLAYGDNQKKKELKRFLSNVFNLQGV